MLAASFVPALDTSNPAQMASARALVKSAMPVDQRRAGQENDILQFSRMDISSWPLEDIAVPTLFLHGDADDNAPHKGSVEASSRMSNAELVTILGADHYMVITRADEINNHISRFLSGLNLAVLAEQRPSVVTAE
jgi:pimeloyl-ACP methyl ester carboxylesterase